MYERVTEAYVFDRGAAAASSQEKNPWALRAIVERLLEAMERGLWEAARRRDSASDSQQIYLDIEGQLETAATVLTRGAGL